MHMLCPLEELEVKLELFIVVMCKIFISSRWVRLVVHFDYLCSLQFLVGSKNLTAIK